MRSHRSDSTGAAGQLARLRAEYDRLAPERDEWKRRNRYYYRRLEDLCRRRVPPSARALELGCGTGDLLASLRPAYGVGLDLSRKMLARAREKYPHLCFVQGDAESLPLAGPFDFVIMSDLIGDLGDIWQALDRVWALCGSETQVVLTYYNFLWEPILRLAQRLGLRMRFHIQNWLNDTDIRKLLTLADFDVVATDQAILLPRALGGLGDWVNDRLGAWPALFPLTLVRLFVARKRERRLPRPVTCTVVVPCRNEVENVRACVERLPAFGTHTEIVFVDGASTDGTVERIEAIIETYRGQKDIRLIHQVSPATAAGRDTPAGRMLPQGKGDAVRKGFAAASGDVLMILDADLTVPPEALPMFLEPLVTGKAEFVNGTRLVYPVEGEAMPTINYLGNKFFSLLFTWLLGQPIRDTLCGTKVLWKEDYERLAAQRPRFGDFDPFGDFDLLFGAAALGLAIAEVPVRYRRRVAGESKVRVLRHGWLLVRMSLIALYHFKLRPLADGMARITNHVWR